MDEVLMVSGLYKEGKCVSCGVVKMMRDCSLVDGEGNELKVYGGLCDSCSERVVDVDVKGGD